MMEPSHQQDTAADQDEVRRARSLCEQGRFLEEKWRQLQFEREILAQEARKLQNLTATVTALLQQTHEGFDERITELLRTVDQLSTMSDRLRAGNGARDTNNVRRLSQYIEEEGSSPSRMSLRLLCQQARYIVVYLDRAIKAQDTACLPRLAEDLNRISAAMSSHKIKTICHEFAAATATRNWSSIQMLHKALDDELAAVAKQSADPRDWAKAG